jgi:hypothetical protein
LLDITTLRERKRRSCVRHRTSALRRNRSVGCQFDGVIRPSLSAVVPARGEMMFGARNAKRPWTPEEDEQLRKMAAAGKNIFVIALKLKRTVSAVRARASILKAPIHGNKKPNSPA